MALKLKHILTSNMDILQVSIIFPETQKSALLGQASGLSSSAFSATDDPGSLPNGEYAIHMIIFLILKDILQTLVSYNPHAIHIP